MHSAFLVAIVRRRAAMTVVSVSTSSKMTSTAAALRRPLPMPSPPRSFLHPSCSSLGTFSSFARHSSGVDSLHSLPSRPGRCTSASALKGKARDSSPSKSPLKSSSPSPLSSSLPALTPDNFPEHVPVLLAEVLKSFACLEEISLYVDGTLGAGGHAAALVRSLAKEKKLKAVVGLDVDARARELASAALSEAAAEVSTAASCPPPVMRVLDANFRDIEEALESVSEELVSEGVFRSPSPPTSSPPTSSASSASKKTRPRLKASAILLDLGVSSMQLGNAERGFSFAADGPLDMRLDGGGGGGKASRDSEDFTSKSSGPLTAATIVNTWPEADLASLFAAREYGGERHAKLAARRIVKAREESEATGGLKTTRQLALAIGRLGPPPKGGKGGGGGGIHPATRVFQALRLAVNDELGALGEVLPKAIDLLEPGGRLAVISFHSGEDRVVKRAFLAAAGKPAPSEDDDDELRVAGATGFVSSRRAISLSPEPPPAPPPAVAKLVTRRPIVAGEKECRSNPRARSAKLRVIEKL